MMKRRLLAALAVMMALGVVASPALAYTFPSTNDLNRDKLVPGREG